MAKARSKPKTLIAARLRETRETCGDKLEILAQKMGVSGRTIAFWEQGEREPNMQTLQRYNELYRVNIHWLITGEGNMFMENVSVFPRKEIDLKRLKTVLAVIETKLEETEKELSIGKMAELIKLVYDDSVLDNEKNRDNIVHLFKNINKSI